MVVAAGAESDFPEGAAAEAGLDGVEAETGAPLAAEEGGRLLVCVVDPAAAVFVCAKLAQRLGPAKRLPKARKTTSTKIRGFIRIVLIIAAAASQHEHSVVTPKVRVNYAPKMPLPAKIDHCPAVFRLHSPGSVGNPSVRPAKGAKTS